MSRLSVPTIALLLALMALQGAACASGGADGRAGNELSVTITAPAANSSVRGITNITGTTSGPDPANTTVTIAFDGGQWFPVRGTGTWSKGWDTLGVENGPHRIRARAADPSGEAFAEVAVMVDNPPPTAPSIRSSVPENSTLTLRVGGNISFSVTTAGGSPLFGVVWLLDGGLRPGPASHNFSYCFNSTGNHTVEAKYLGGDSVIDSRHWNITVLPPNQPPVMLDVTLEPGNYSASVGDSSDFKVRASDPEGANLTYQWLYDGQPLNTTDQNITLKLEKAGKHTLRAIVSDGEDNVTVSWTFTVEQAATAGLTDFAPCVAYVITGILLGVLYGRKVRAKQARTGAA